jgi:predicted nucleic acid-binding Zn ribbon protein
MNQDFKRQGEEKPLGQLVKGIMKAYGLEEKMKSYDLIAAWPELMGPAVAQRTKDIKIQNNTLYLTIDSSVMRDELFLGKQIIIARCNAHVGEELIRDIWFN